MGNSPIISFSAHTVSGAGRGKSLGAPTINLDPREVPAKLEHGIYAGYVSGEHLESVPVAIHYGPRPVFGDDTVTFEVHVLDATIDTPPAMLTVEIIERLRDVRDFPTERDLKKQIAMDINHTKRIIHHS